MNSSTDCKALWGIELNLSWLLSLYWQTLVFHVLHTNHQNITSNFLTLLTPFLPALNWTDCPEEQNRTLFVSRQIISTVWVTWFMSYMFSYMWHVESSIKQVKNSSAVFHCISFTLCVLYTPGDSLRTPGSSWNTIWGATGVINTRLTKCYFLAYYVLLLMGQCLFSVLVLPKNPLRFITIILT